MNKNETTEAINNKFLKAKSIEDASKIDAEYGSGSVAVKDMVKNLCKLHRKQIGAIIGQLGLSTSTFYSRFDGKNTITKGFIIEIAFAIGITLAELTELLKIANVAQLDAKRNREDRYVLMFFGRNIDSNECNKSNYDIWDLEELLKEKIKYKDREIIFSITKKY